MTKQKRNSQILGKLKLSWVFHLKVWPSFHWFKNLWNPLHRNMKFVNKNFLRKCDQPCSFQRIYLHLLKKFFIGTVKLILCIQVNIRSFPSLKCLWIFVFNLNTQNYGTKSYFIWTCVWQSNKKRFPSIYGPLPALSWSILWEKFHMKTLQV